MTLSYVVLASLILYESVCPKWFSHAHVEIDSLIHFNKSVHP